MCFSIAEIIRPGTPGMFNQINQNHYGNYQRHFFGILLVHCAVTYDIDGCVSRGYQWRIQDYKRNVATNRCVGRRRVVVRRNLGVETY